MRRLLALVVLLALAGAVVGGARWWRSRRAPSPEPAAPVSAGPVPAGPAGEEQEPGRISYRCYFPLRAGFGLGEEIRVYPQPQAPIENVRAVVDELHKGPSADSLVPIYPKGTRARAVYLVDGTLYVDEPPEVFQQPLGLREEMLFVRAIARTLLRNCPEVKAFVLLSGGAARHTLFSHFPAHGKYILPAQGAR